MNQEHDDTVRMEVHRFHLALIKFMFLLDQYLNGTLEGWTNMDAGLRINYRPGEADAEGYFNAWVYHVRWPTYPSDDWGSVIYCKVKQGRSDVEKGTIHLNHLKHLPRPSAGSVFCPFTTTIDSRGKLSIRPDTQDTQNPIAEALIQGASKLS